MDFKSTLPIYLQIADYIGDKIISREWPETERVPSARDLGVELQVNPNTVIRAFENLQAENIISNRRGVGYFVEEGALKEVLRSRRRKFMTVTLPEVFETMQLLGIEPDEITAAFEALKKAKA